MVAYWSITLGHLCLAQLAYPGKIAASMIKDKLGKTIKAVTRRIAGAHLKFLRYSLGEAPITLRYWLVWRKLLGILWFVSNPLLPPENSLCRDTKLLARVDLIMFLAILILDTRH